MLDAGKEKGLSEIHHFLKKDIFCSSIISIDFSDNLTITLQ